MWQELLKTKVNRSNYLKELQGSFELDVRTLDLYKRVETYYKQTPNSVSNDLAVRHRKDLELWASDRGYTIQELKRVKHTVGDYFYKKHPDEYR